MTAFPVPARLDPPAAILWDFDGTLIDTEPTWVRVEQELLSGYGVDWTVEQGAALSGTSWQYATQKLIDATGDGSLDLWDFYVQRYTRVAQHLREAGDLPWRPGAEALLEDLYRRRVPCGVVSQSPRELLDAGLERIKPGRLQVVVTGDDLAAGKPDPMGFLMAAARLGVRASDCLVIEDSPAGCEAGRRAGAVVLGVPCMTPLDPGPRTIIQDTLVGLDTQSLARLWAGQQGSNQ